MWAASGAAPIQDRPAGESRLLKIVDGAGWSFLGGQWTEDEDGIIRPPDRRNLHSRAFFAKESFGDLEAEFEFNPSYRETGTGCAGLVLRATDASHFYFVYFPWCAMNLRAKHFWTIVAKVEGDGYLRNIKSAWVPGVPSETERWFKVRVAAEGSRITVWVNDHPALSVTDGTYRSGRVGLAGYGWYAFRNVRVSGRKVPATAWDERMQIAKHWFEVGVSSQEQPSACVAPNGDVLLLSGKALVRSRDKGRNWAEPAALPEAIGRGGEIFCTSQNRLMIMFYRRRDEAGRDTPEVLIADSADNGHNWSDPTPSCVSAGWPEQPAKLHPYGGLVETKDGTLLRFLYGEVGEFREWGTKGTLSDIRTWSAVHCKAYAIRSTDSGRSWSAPIEMDQPAWVNARRGTIFGSMDFTESTGVAIGNRVTVLIRPVYSPLMWQCWSNDSGATWDAAIRTTFPGYAQSIVRTASGAILCGHRFPLYSINMSTDDGVTWDEGTVIDYPGWAMGCAVEVEPDVVLVTYMGAERDYPLHAQLIRVSRGQEETRVGEGTRSTVRLVPLNQ